MRTAGHFVKGSWQLLMTTGTSLFSRIPISILLLVVSAALVLGPGGCSCKDGNNGVTASKSPFTTPPGPPPAPGSPQYAPAISGLYAGLIAVNSSANDIAIRDLTDASKIAPGEPMIWAGLGLAYMSPKPNDLVQAGAALDKAAFLAPNNSLIVMLQSALEHRRGNTVQEIERLRSAVKLDPKNVQALFILDQRLLAQSDSKVARVDLHKKMLVAQPENIAFLLYVLEDAVDAGDLNQVRSLVDQIKQQIDIVPAGKARDYLAELEKALATNNIKAAIGPNAQFRNMMLGSPARKQAVAYLPNETKGIIVKLPEMPLVMQAPSPTPAVSDSLLAFTAQPLSGTNQGKWTQARTFTLVPELSPEIVESGFKALHPSIVVHKEMAPVTLLANGTTVQLVGADGKAIQSLPYPGGPAALTPQPNSILIQDFTYDFLPDMVFAGPGGFRLYEQTPKHTFKDVTARTKLSPSVVQGVYIGAWAVDIEADGDLDIVLGAALGMPTVLQNNSDGTWEPTHPFVGIEGVRAFAWGDFDNDGDGDAAIIDGQGHLAVFENLRGGKFRPWKNLPADLGKVTALSAADPTRRGTMDIVALLETGSIVRISLHPDKGGWEKEEIGLRTEAAQDSNTRLFWSDLDNNGAIDLIVSSDSGTRVFLGNPTGKFDPLTTVIEERIWSVDETTRTVCRI